MSALHLVELRPDLTALLHFIHGQGLDVATFDEDLGYGVHAWLAAAFGRGTLRPWRLLHDRRRPTRILAYSQQNSEQLRERLSAFADPSVFAVCADPAESILSRPMPKMPIGKVLGFEVQCCPVGRKAGSGIEKDIFLIEADNAEERNLSRESVYTAWAVERLERDNACTVQSVRLEGFRLVRQLRQTQKTENGRTRARLVRPMALLRGELVVRDPESFQAMLAGGIGRHLAFGYGMVLLRPPQ